MFNSVMKYHNQSNILIGGSDVADGTSKKEIQRKMKTEEYNSKLRTFDPKEGNKSHIFFGEEKPNFSKKQAS